MRFGIIANLRKKLFWERLPTLLDWFEKNKISIILSERIVHHKNYPARDYDCDPEEVLPEKCNMILAFGGDGTILHSVQLARDKATPVLGINVGGLGFLTEIPLENFEHIFSQILEGKYWIESRFLIQCDIAGEDKSLYALNEIVIDKGKSVRVIEIQINVDQKYLNTYIADGLLVSTPTGSTGYSLSSGGPIIVPSTNVLIINPICPHSLTNRPVIVPDTAVVEAIVRTEYPEVPVAADGQDIRYCKNRTHLTIRKAPFSARLVKHVDSDFFALLRNKLNWGEDFRDKSRWSYNS